MRIYQIDREKVVNYAKEWAFRRNPRYYDFERLGGDCTNFISQCIFAGCGVMNYTPLKGWYYNSLNDRAPAWTGVDEFYSFIVKNKGVGPFAEQTYIGGIKVGDVVQLYRQGKFFHSVLVTSIINGEILTASHTRDTFNKPLFDYSFERARFLHIKGYRK